MEVRLPILDLTRAFKDVREEVQAAVDRVFDAQSFILGREVRAFEEHVESYLELPEGAISSIGTVCPKRCTGRKAFVRGVRRRSTSCRSTL